MNLLGIGEIIGGVGKIADDLITTDKERLTLALDEKKIEARLIQSQIEVNKAEANPPGVNANLCRQCDWRPDCTAENARKHRCMSYAVILDDGTEVGRADGVSVVFKRLPPNAN